MATQSMNPFLSNWNPPRAGWLKLNTDGSSLGNPGQSSYGGLIRNSLGDWICGYAGKIGYNTGLVSEMWGILMGLRLIRALGFNNVVIETDCQVALLLITATILDESDPNMCLINACRSEILKLKCYMIHVKRAGNRCANEMAELGHRQPEEFLVYSYPPPTLCHILEEDAKGKN